MTRFFLLNFRIFFARHHLRRGSSFVLLVEIVAGAQALTLGERVRVCVCVCVERGGDLARRIRRKQLVR